MPVLVKGLKSTLKNLSKAGPEVQAAYRAAARFEAEKIMTESERQVPVDTGNLKNSRFFTQQDTPNGSRFVLGYRADYSVYVHEDMTANHPNGGNAKFLERPLLKGARGFDKRVAQRVKDSLAPFN